ncbi:MAG: ornithine carbamoyltransferase, partial [candidate division NC10 bacterium]|nr:ornithine carbamoyltransferase [candidate division NC10 bacterium]
HPCQVLCDLFTLQEKRKKLKGLRVAFIGDGNNVCNSWLYGAAKMGIHLTVACPKGYEPHRDVFTKARAESEATYAVLQITHDAAKAAKDADVIYTDVWASMGHEEQRAKRMRDFLSFQVNQDLVKLAQKDVLVMHCLPAHRGEEITDEVMEGRHSVILEQAENRLHMQKAILVKLLGDKPK